jgi:hypothetical protein
MYQVHSLLLLGLAKDLYALRLGSFSTKVDQSTEDVIEGKVGLPLKVVEDVLPCWVEDSRGGRRLSLRLAE